MRLFKMTTLVVAVLSTSACSSLEPWVKPYERAALAEEVMSNDRLSSINEYTLHVREVREGSHGASGAAGGGCGCN